MSFSLFFFLLFKAILDGHMKTACDMTEVGETASRVDALIKEINAFEKIFLTDVSHAEEIVQAGKLPNKF